ncbi:MAG: hypothetical protein JZU55_17330, partial [Afipia sp.]|nr:hypothetical protein [Afipia sp.]
METAKVFHAMRGAACPPLFRLITRRNADNPFVFGPSAFSAVTDSMTDKKPKKPQKLRARLPRGL